MQAMVLNQVCQDCHKGFTGASNRCDDCTMVGMTLKHEGEVAGKAIGPLFVDFKSASSPQHLRKLGWLVSCQRRLGPLHDAARLAARGNLTES
jgi:hypothetical protein